MTRWRPKTIFHVVFLAAAVTGETAFYETDYISISLVNPDKRSARSSEKEPFKKMDDMLFTEETWMIWNSPVRGILQSATRWPKDNQGNVIVPYEISPTYVGNKAALTAGQLQWSSKTCIKFIEKSDPALPAGMDVNYLSYEGGTGCSSYVGMTGGKQGVTLGATCDTESTVAHELGHALGFGHEQQRPDRDDYIVMITSNIQPDLMDNYDKELNTDTYGVPYYYMASLHYGWNSGAIDYNKPTMVPKDPSMRYLVTGGYPVSHYEASAANQAYGCIDTWKAKCGATIPTCINYGYVGPDCKCVCPEGTTGANCGTVTVPSLPAYPPSPCGGKITTAGSYAVPNMGGARPPGLECIWYVEAPLCTTAQVTMTSFNVDGGDATCAGDKLLIGSTNLYVPEIGPLCGDATVVPDGTKYQGSPSLALYYTSITDYPTGAGGFKFQVEFLPQATCTVTTTTPPTVPTAKPAASTKKPNSLVTTTRAPSLEKCSVIKVDNKTFIWTSQGFPGKVPANSRCSIFGTTTTGGFNVALNYFRVTSDPDCTSAHVYFSPSYPMKKLCNDKTGMKFKLYRNFFAFQFQSNPKYSTTGFNITISAF